MEQKNKSILLFAALGIVNCIFKKQTKMKKLLFFAMIASSLFACQSETKPAFDLANAKKEIEAANDAIGEIISKGDSVGMAAAYSTDGSVMFSNMPSIKGKDQLTTVWGSYIRAGLSKIDLTTLEVWGDENYITEEGLFEIELVTCHADHNGGAKNSNDEAHCWESNAGQATQQNTKQQVACNDVEQRLPGPCTHRFTIWGFNDQ